MTEYANPFVNMMIKNGFSKSAALMFAKSLSNVDFEKVIARATQLANDEDFKYEFKKAIDRNNVNTKNFISDWLDKHMD